MKKSRKTSLLVSAASIAGLAVGASIALAHPAVPLYTYEEVATQYGQAAMQVYVDPTTHQGFPYSPKQTCTGGDNAACHGGIAGYETLSKHAFHSALGFNEWMDNDQSGLFIGDGTGNTPAGIQTGLNPQKPWLQSHGHNGKW